MKITLVTEHRLPVVDYGGTERVVWSLAYGLSHLGHKVTLIAMKGSHCPFATTITYNNEEEIPSLIPLYSDIVHFHGKVYQTSKPYVVTMHGNMKKGSKADINTIFLSNNHANRHHADTFVYNGLKFDDYGSVPTNNIRLHFHFLGKAAWRVKNVAGAIDTIKLLPEERLWVMGGSRINFKMGFRCTLSRQVSFLPKAYGKQKLDLLKESKGLIFPVLWHEPFGLAIIESLYCGAPVFGTPYGSLPEIVKSDVGFLSSNMCELAEHIDHSSLFSNKYCHEYAAEVFSAERMAKDYLTVYEKVLNGEKLNKNVPYADSNDRNLQWLKCKKPLYTLTSEE